MVHRLLAVAIGAEQTYPDLMDKVKAQVLYVFDSECYIRPEH